MGVERSRPTIGGASATPGGHHLSDSTITRGKKRERERRIRQGIFREYNNKNGLYNERERKKNFFFGFSLF